MERVIETADCKSLRLFLWNEKLARNQISQSEGLCLFIIKKYIHDVSPFVSRFSSLTATAKADLRYPPDVPLYCRFENDDKEEEGVVTVRNVSAADDWNDPFCKYTEDVLEYLDMLRE
ncbi:hypothetical protein H5410_044348 [Solanum commersonii]|uniref:Uncharacterized protein n=1 Tax=Solanum commersonii TaxID=4109 RepID=A0A9J5X7T3_SOLCO|nr:hypothetical protein H5410_044348 [Solanum commersonii]